MASKNHSSIKVGLFALVAILLVAYLTLRVSDMKFSPGGTYSIYLEMPSAEGIDTKTPVQVAGIQVGIVEEIGLTAGNLARLKLKIRKGVILPADARAEVRVKGVLGDAYLEIVPGSSGQSLAAGDTIRKVGAVADFNELTRNLNDVAINLKDISQSIKTYVNPDNSSFARIMTNMDKLTANLATFAGNNRENMDAIVINLKELTSGLKGIVKDDADEINRALSRIDSITAKIDQGKGTIGKLLNDPSTADKLNEGLDNINEVVGSVNKLKFEFGYHLEYLGGTNDYKNYAHLNIWPRPDKGFLFEFISDPNPPPVRSTTTSTVTTGGVSNTVVTSTEQIQRNKFRISAEFAKKFYDFTIHGGIIESTGGIGVDYNKGPFGIQFEAFDFADQQRPHLKAMATANMTKSIYLLGGVDDFIAKGQTPDWFFGAGIRFLDEDIKSLFGAFSLGK